MWCLWYTSFCSWRGSRRSHSKREEMVGQRPMLQERVVRKRESERARETECGAIAWYSKLSLVSWLLSSYCCRLLTCLYTSDYWSSINYWSIDCIHNEWYSMSNDEIASAIGCEIHCSWVVWSLMCNWPLRLMTVLVANQFNRYL